MRASDFVSEVINPDTRHSEFSHELEIDGITYRANNSGEDLIVKAYTPEGVVIGAAKFVLPKQDTHSMSSMWTKVAPLFKKQGIASNMYAYARMLGNTIKPANFQLDAGRKMWDKWRETGAAKHLSETDDDMFAPSIRERIANGLILAAKNDLQELMQTIDVAQGPDEKEWAGDQIADIPQVVELANIFRTEPLAVALERAEALSYTLSIDFVDSLMHYANIDLRTMFPDWEPDN